jgi:hypothetical protein
MNADLWNKVYTAIKESDGDFANIIQEAAFFGSIDAVIWLREQGFPWIAKQWNMPF